MIGHNITNCSPHVRDSKTVLNSGLQAVDSRFQVMDSGFFVDGTWIMAGFQSLVGFRIPWAVFWILKPRIWDSTSKNVLDSKFHKQKNPVILYPDLTLSYSSRERSGYEIRNPDLYLFAHGADTKTSLMQITELSSDNCANTVATCSRSMTNLFFLMRGSICHDQKGHFTVI